MKHLIRVVFLYNTISSSVLNHLRTELKEFPNIEIIIPQSTEISDMIPLVEKADVLVGWKCPKELLPYTQHLKLYISPYTGVSYLIKAFKQMTPPPHFPIVNAHGAAKLIAQHAVAMLFGIMNHLIIHHNDMLNGNWIPGGEGVEEPCPSIPIEGRKIGLFGYGQINQTVHKYLRGFPVEFHALKRSWKKTSEEKHPNKIVQYSPKQLDIFMKNIDTLIIAAPLTPETENLIRMKQLKLLGPDGIIVNVGRAKIINEKDLFNVL